jgi:uncharacterized phage-like protein YoqJ
MIIAGTGHRPDKLGGYDPHTSLKVARLAVRVLEHYQPQLVISGMAQGWDMALAQAAVSLKIPYHAYVPFNGHHLVWPSATKAYYRALLARAEVLEVCSAGDYTPRAMQIRNQRMVNKCDFLAALWNGSPGGTANCLSYATFTNTPFINFWPHYIVDTDENKTPFPDEPIPDHEEDHGTITDRLGSDWLDK